MQNLDFGANMTEIKELGHCNVGRVGGTIIKIIVRVCMFANVVCCCLLLDYPMRSRKEEEAS